MSTGKPIPENETKRDLVEAYGENRLNRGYSSETSRTVRSNLRLLERHLREHRSKELKDATRDEVQDYLLKLVPQIKSDTLVGKITHIRGFFRFLLKEGLIAKDPTENLDIPRGEPSLPKDVPDERSMECLLNQPDSHTYTGIRDKAILELMYSCALRSKEVRGLTISDVDLKDMSVQIRQGKGDKGRVVPLGKRAKEALQIYLEVTRPFYSKRPQEERLFLIPGGKPMSLVAVCRLVERYRVRSKLTEDITPHTIRHACALHMLRGGAPIHTIQELLGHKRLSTTKIYTRLYPEDLKKIHQKYHPREHNPL